MLVNMREGMRFGMGMDGLTEQVRGRAIDHDGDTTSSGGAKTRSGVRLIESQETLLESLNVSVGASFRYGLASVEAKVQFVRESEVNSRSLYVQFWAYVQSPARTMINPRLSAAAKALYETSPGDFRSLYGDHFIDEIYSGGEFFGLFKFETRSERSHSDLQADLRASVGGFFAGGEIKAAFRNAVDTFKQKTNMSILVMMDGSEGLQNPSDLDDLQDLYRGFNAAVRDNPVDYRANLKEMKYLPLPTGLSWAESHLREQIITECGRQVVDGLAQRNEVGFILRYPEQFESFDTAPLVDYRAALEARLPRWARRATACSDDTSQCVIAPDEDVPVPPPFPRRLRDEDPLVEKWEWILAHDDLISVDFRRENLGGRSTRDDWQPGPRGGRFILFRRDNGEGEPCAGLFHHPSHGTYGVAWNMFRLYWADGGPHGGHGYPISDELFMSEHEGWFPRSIYPFEDGDWNIHGVEVGPGWRRQIFEYEAEWRHWNIPESWHLGWLETRYLNYRVSSPDIPHAEIFEDGPNENPTLFELPPGSYLSLGPAWETEH
ncbi:hypothetical protein [Streptomyces sp. NPDC002133]|uniref:hypothetical protein n=1 Tax=Streptomyces sp. NPDC002133 TaxID=3154409 RepID=UPI003321035F